MPKNDAELVCKENKAEFVFRNNSTNPA